MACSSNWWRAPVYFTVSVLLAFLAISTALRSLPRDNSLPTKTTIAPLLLDASSALRKSGFNIIATLLQITPEIFISSPHSTIFAIPDSSIANASHTSWLLKHLFQYHASPLQLSMKDLLKKHRGSCFPTLFHGKNVALTKVDEKERVVEINHVLVSHPDIFLNGPLTIHGVLGPFTSMDPRYVNQGWDHIQAPICDSNLSLVSEAIDTKNVVEWTHVIRLLSSKGFVSFAIGLNSVLDGILYDKMKLNSVTVFAPPEFSFVASASSLLEKIVRFHILPRKLTYMELASLPANATLCTLAPDHDLEISKAVNITQELMINQVKIVAPNMFESKKFVIHGISQAFKLDELPNTSR
ncbi:hypothetical protein Goshw_007485 [Gossypium schwendimanii]|uniref:FAS1 domain-containing protein n=3 Tax=Gossypium TaxID=3633 RepID=A0A7J9L845_GOSSC|nr:hypothetical protein [Gossypium lobatum]MBA0711822.1 hypothetical protein [Gossypium laxum]MBA0854982.1 hypothetical protein [Gossypium schwendimanii]